MSLRTRRPSSLRTARPRRDGCLSPARAEVAPRTARRLDERVVDHRDEQAAACCRPGTRRSVERRRSRPGRALPAAGYADETRRRVGWSTEGDIVGMRPASLAVTPARRTPRRVGRPSAPRVPSSTARGRRRERHCGDGDGDMGRRRAGARRWACGRSGPGPARRSVAPCRVPVVESRRSTGPGRAPAAGHLRARRVDRAVRRSHQRRGPFPGAAVAGSRAPPRRWSGARRTR